jgi:serine/threonine protein kinase
MFTDEQISSLLLRLQEARAKGQPCTVEDVCGQRPDLIAEVKRQLAILDHVGALSEPDTSDPGVTRVTELPEMPPRLPHAVAGLAGTRLGRYHLLRQLGQGGMGEVYEADDERLDRRVAVKVMKPEVALVPENRERFLREGRRQASLESDHIVPIHDSGEEDGVPFLVMPLLRGETLEERLKREPRLPVGLALQVGWQTADGLAVAHERGLIHRDIKPANVWLEGDKPGEVQRARILDFGLARSVALVDSVTQAGMIVGTPGYLAPEQMEGQPGDARADLFSLGVMLYRMIAGQRPFEGSSMLALVRAMAVGEPRTPETVNPAVPKPLSELILRMLARDPEQRPASSREVANQLRAIEPAPTTPQASVKHVLPPLKAPGGRNSGSQPPVTITEEAPVRRKRPSRRTLVLGLAGLVFAMGGLGAWWIANTKSTHSSAASTLKTDLDVTVWKAGRHGKPGQRLWSPGVLPLRPGDAVRIEATVDRPAYLYLVWLDGTGKATPVYPWREDDWKNRPKVEARLTRLILPEGADKGGTMEGTKSGVESLVLIALEEQLPASVDAAALFGGLKDQGDSLPKPDLAAWLVNGEPDKDVAERGPYKEVASVYDPVGAVRDLVRKQVNPLGGASRVVSFGYSGR